MTVHGTNPASAGGGDSFPGGAAPSGFPGPYDNDFPGPYAQPAQTVNAAPAQNFSPADPYEGYVDYFGFDVREKWYFPDKRQWIEFKKLTEGERAKYLKATKSDVYLNRQSNDARISFDQSGDRKALLVHSITNWHLVRRDPSSGSWSEVRFPGDNRSPGGGLSQWIDNSDPALLAELEKAIRKVNPWLMSEMTVEQIDKEIADLTELRATAEKREAEEANFSNK